MTSEKKEETSGNPLQAALDKFYAAWFAGEPEDVEAFCEDHPDMGPELRERIDSFLLVADNFSSKDETQSDGQPASPEDEDSTQQMVLGDFRIIRELGRGGMGVVYEAEQISLNRKVALKVLQTHLAFSNESILKFRREAEAGGKQHHPGIVSVYAVGQYKGTHYIAQELVEGGYTLADKIEAYQKEDELPIGYFRDVARMVAQLTQAFEPAHASGVIHRDIKPSNILLTADGSPKVTDFGLAKVQDALALSRTGDFAGTPYYMSPEQAASKRMGIDHRTDIYSLGVTLYELLTLSLPFEGETTQEVLRKILLKDPIDPRKENPRVPRDLAVICLKAMEKDANHRYPSMEAFGDDLERFLSGEVILARPAGLGTRAWKCVKRNPVVSTAAGVALAALVFFAAVVPWIMYKNEQALVRKEQESAAMLKIERDKAIAAQEEKEKQRGIAEEQARIAKERARLIQNNLDDIMRLSDVKRLADLEADAEQLWPAHPDMIAQIEAWLTRADEVLGRLDEHRQTLASLRENARPYGDSERIMDLETHPQWNALQGFRDTRANLEKQIAELEAGDAKAVSSAEGAARGVAEEAAQGAAGNAAQGSANSLAHGSDENASDGPVEERSSQDLEKRKEQLAELDAQIDLLEETVSKRRTWEFKDTETQWQHNMLAGLVSGLVALYDEKKGLYRDVRGRLAFASTIEAKSITGHQTAWAKAIASIADRETCPQYDGLVIEPMIGLVPIGRDPASGLWEFAHLQTGEIPERGPDGKIVRTEKMGLVFVIIPGGRFNMGAEPPSEKNPIGSPNVDPEAKWNEGPVHEVTMRPFLLSKYEMTQGQWLRFTEKNPSQYDPEWIFGDHQHNLLHPVESVNWTDCRQVLVRLKLRLPSESEWEYAARAGTNTAFWTGNDKASLQDAGNVADQYFKINGGTIIQCEESLNDGYASHAPVGTYLSNAFGLHDVIGNVFEWCEDYYTENYENAPVDGSANISGSSFRVFRGGSWIDVAFRCRSSYRYGHDEGLRYDFLGLRPVADIP